MRKFNVMTFCYDFTPPEQFKDEFMMFLSDEPENVISTNNDAIRQLSKAVTCPFGDFRWGDISLINLPKCFIRGALNSDDTECLKSVYKTLYPNDNLFNVAIHRVIKKYGTISVGYETYGSKMSCRNLKSARIRAAYAGTYGEISHSLTFRPGYVDYYFSHDIKDHNN